MTVKVLLNPYANRWKAQKRWPEADAALKAAGVNFSLDISEAPGQPELLAERAIRDGFDCVVAAGGDGTIGEIVNGVARSNPHEADFPATIGVLPMGSANDFEYAVGLPVGLEAAARVIAAGKTRAVDLCRCNGRCFLNNSGLGLEPYVTTKQERIRWIHGITRYLVAALWAIWDKPEWTGTIRWDTGEYRGPLSLVSVGNGRRTGGFFMTPHADPFDGKLTLAFGHRFTRGGLLAALPKAMKEGKGNYLELEGMREVHCTWVKIQLDKPSPVHTDGVLFDKWMTDLEYQIEPRRVPVLMPGQ